MLYRYQANLAEADGCHQRFRKLTGPKAPLRAKHVWAIRTRLQMSRRLRDLALFNLAIDSKLRGCDLTRLKVSDVAPHGYALARATVRQMKTGRPVTFEITEQSRQAIEAYLQISSKSLRTSSSADAKGGIMAFRPDSMRACLKSGSRVLAWALLCTAHTLCVVQRRP